MNGNEISAKPLNDIAKNYLQKQNQPFIKYFRFSVAMFIKVSYGICTKIKCYKKEFKFLQIHLSSFMPGVADYNPDNKKQGEA
jgi:hypothetical protein